MIKKDPRLTLAQLSFESEEAKRAHLKTLTIHALLHTLWSKTLRTDNYDKAEWLELEERLHEKGLMKP